MFCQVGAVLARLLLVHMSYSGRDLYDTAHPQHMVTENTGDPAVDDLDHDLNIDSSARWSIS